MIVEVRVPVFAESIQEGTLLEWQKQPGDTVARGEHLVDIETDKVVLEVAAPEAGVLRDLLKPAGETVTSEEPIATIDTAAAAREVEARPAPAPAEPAAPALSPAVRRLVAEHGLDPREVPGSGRGGRVTRPDVLAYLAGRQAGEAPTGSPAAAPAPPPPSAPTPAARSGRPERREKVSRIRARIAERLVEAQHRAALLTTFNEVDVTAVMALRRRYRDRFQEAHGVRLGLMSFFARAAVAALQRFPVLNARLEGEEVVYHDYYDVGIAVASPRGLVVPILRDVDRLSFADIERAIADFADRARDGRLRPEELAGGTFTVTNGGVFGSLLSTPIVNPPQSAILGMHKVQDRPVAEDGQVVVRPMMYLALTYDHRLVDGREAVQFLVTVKEAIEDPARLLLGV